MRVEALCTSLDEAEHFQSFATDETAGNSNKFPANSTLVQAVGRLQDEIRHPPIYIRGDNLRV